MKKLILAIALLCSSCIAQGQVTIYQGGAELVFAYDSTGVKWLDKDGMATTQDAAVKAKFTGTRNGRTGTWCFNLTGIGIMVKPADGT